MNPKNLFWLATLPVLAACAPTQAAAPEENPRPNYQELGMEMERLHVAKYGDLKTPVVGAEVIVYVKSDFKKNATPEQYAQAMADALAEATYGGEVNSNVIVDGVLEWLLDGGAENNALLTGLNAAQLNTNYGSSGLTCTHGVNVDATLTLEGGLQYTQTPDLTIWACSAVPEKGDRFGPNAVRPQGSLYNPQDERVASEMSAPSPVKRAYQGDADAGLLTSKYAAPVEI